MKYTGLISSDARGKLGGNVGSRNRYGTYLRRHVSPVQPRTVSQQANRQTFGAISSEWRTLTTGQQAGWNTLATTVTFKNSLGAAYNPTGAQLFMLFNRMLFRLGASSVASAPSTLPTIPALVSITPTITVASNAVTAISLAFTPTPIPAANSMLIYASKPLSSGVTFTGKSMYRFISTATNATASPVALLTAYTNVFGTPPAVGKIAFRALLVDNTTGYYGPFIQALAAI